MNLDKYIEPTWLDLQEMNNPYSIDDEISEIVDNYDRDEAVTTLMDMVEDAEDELANSAILDTSRCEKLHEALDRYFGVTMPAYF